MLNSQSTRSQRQTCAAQKNFRQIAWKLYLVGMMLYFVNCVRITELEKIEMLSIPSSIGEVAPYIVKTLPTIPGPHTRP